MEPISVLAIGAAVVAGTAVVAGVVAALRGKDEQAHQIKHQATQARRQMEQTSHEYLNNVEKLLRRKR